MSSAITGLDLDQQLPSLKLGGPRESRFEVKSRRVVHLLRRARGKDGWWWWWNVLVSINRQFIPSALPSKP